MALPNTDNALGYPYDRTPAGNTAHINDRTYIRQVDDRLRVAWAEARKALDKALENDQYLEERETTIAQALNSDIAVRFDAGIQRGNIVFPVDKEEQDGVDYITVRQRPQQDNIATDAIGMVLDDASVGDIAPIRTRGLVTDLFWPRDLEPPTPYQQALIGYDARDGWNLIDPATYDLGIVRTGQKLIGMYLDYTEGPPAKVDLLLTGFSQSNLSKPDVVYKRLGKDNSMSRIVNNAANLTDYHNAIEGIITPRRFKGVEITIALYLRFFNAGAATVVNAASTPILDLQRNGESLYDFPWEETMQTNNAVSTPKASATVPAHTDWYPFMRTFIDHEAEVGEENRYTLKYRNPTYDTIATKFSHIRLEEIDLPSD